jgi:hypothetical protein
VKYPARTLYENLVASRGSLHDIVFGSNGRCNKKPTFESDGTSSCIPSEEAVQCSGKAICLVQEGYDGPTGVGTPNGISAFQPPIAKEVEKASAGVPISAPPGALASPGTTTSSSPSPAVQPTIRLSAFALTPNALIALRRVRPRISSVGFVFTLSAAARVRATLAKQLNAHGRRRWQTLPYSLTSAATRGRNRRRLSSRNPLTPGRYRLTLAPQHGGARSITFQVT